jgi:rfaE bifunctional protein kinase chain/domain
MKAEQLSPDRLRQLRQSFAGRRIAVVGDLMVDRYYWGKVTRVSPEAPVPVVDVVSESARLGGAANVANNIQSLGGIPLLVGLTGDDHPGELLRGLMTEQGLDTSGLVIDASRPTTIKTRVIAHDQHVVRIDYESKGDCPPDAEDRLVDLLRERVGELDALIFEDYNKGVLTKNVIRRVTELARSRGITVTVDPKFENFFEYRNVTVFKPNRRETEEVLGGRLRSAEDLFQAGKRMLRELGAENVLITRGEDGMSLFQSDGSVLHIPTMADHVLDVSGAGDTVIATLTMALAAGAQVREAVMLANVAGGIVVGSVGIVPIGLNALMEAAGSPRRMAGG